MEHLKVRITGETDLLMHSDRLLNDFDPLTVEKKALTAKKVRKTDADKLRIMQIELEGALYWLDGEGVYLPGDNLRKSVIEAARLTREGKGFERGFYVDDAALMLKYRDGPATIERLISEPKFRFVRGVVQARQRIMRARPIFRDWSCEAHIAFDPSQIKNKAAVLTAMEAAGLYVGVGDWRVGKGGRFGKFTVAEVK